MFKSRLLALLLLLLGVFAVFPARGATTSGWGRIMRVSVASDGAQADGATWRSGFSADGRVVAFVSDAWNLTGIPIPYGQPQLYAFDRATNQTTRLPIAPPQTPIDLATITHELAVSGDGRFVAFDSLSALVPDDTNAKRDIFVHDRLTEQTSRVSVRSDGGQNDGSATQPRLSFDGRFVLFAAESSLLLPGYAGYGVFIRDRQSGTTEAVSVATNGTPADAIAGGGTLSDDGRLVAFISGAGNLDDDAVPGTDNVFLRDRQTGQTTWLWGDENGASIDAVDLSGDGRYLAITTRASCYYDVCDYRLHLFDRQAGRVVGTFRDVVASSGSHQFLATAGPILAFLTNTPLVPEDDDGALADVYRFDFLTGELTLITKPEFGPSVWYDAPMDVAISADGREIAFRSKGPYFVAGDTNNQDDVFVWTAGTSSIYLPAIR